MPTHEFWIEENILAVTWIHPLTPGELSTSFRKLASFIADQDHRVHVLFDIREAKTIPAQAPVLAIRSRFLSKANTGSVAVVGTDVIAQILAEVATGITRREILFFPLYDAALNYLKSSEEPVIKQGG